MTTCIIIGEDEILGIVARHLAKHNATSIRSARWLGPLREIGASLLTKAQRKAAPSVIPAKAEIQNVEHRSKSKKRGKKS
ncbi:MAG: hypothetical protein HY360_07530 [Verrucomicrobia bacterium]|nr:hypothetical protein [Verrucomicrobiota bacterium]